MNTRMLSNYAIAKLLPDVPRWVEARALLLQSPCEIFGFQEEPQLSLALREQGQESLFIIGAPSMTAIQSALEHGPCDEIIAPPELAVTLQDALPAWAYQRILVHHLAAPLRLPETAGNEVRFLDPAAVGSLAIDDELKEELEEGPEQGLIAAAFVNGQPASFCYAGAITESWWDIAVDTLPAHRRRGYAALCVAFMIRHMQAGGKHPVWQAVEHNPASWMLARKLGFAAIDELALFEPREE